MATLLHRLSAVEYFTFGFGTMVGVGWLVLGIAVMALKRR